MSAAQQHRYDVILLDIEGTTTPISFVKDTLFPYNRRNLRFYLESTINTQQTRDDIRALIQQANQDHAAFPAIAEGPVHLDAARDPESITPKSFQSQLAAIEANVLAQMDVDRKIGALKQLQGHMWRVGYESGELLGSIYDDAYECMKQWHDAGMRVCIYSSGSVDAQKLIFGYTSHGSLLPLLDAHFDTAVGMKQKQQSYENIIRELGVDAKRLLFCTDMLGEAKAAREAGVDAVVVVRDGNAPVAADCGFQLVQSFHDIRVNA